MIERTEVRLAGFGGQGIARAGFVLGKAIALADGKEAVFTQEYGPESRGGASSASIVASTAAIDELLYGIIDARRAGPPREDLLGTLIAATDDDGSRMDARQLRDEAVTLFLAGPETTALLLAHALYFLSLHPNVRHRLHREIDEVLGGRTPSAEDVKQLSFTKQVLDETMRLLPPAWTTGREATEDVVIAGNRIPKGAQILISQWVVHRDPRWFPNPEGFDPDRWSPERAKAIPRYAYFPFGGGPRVCIGNHFAMMEATLILVRIAQHYRVDLLPGQTLELRPSVTLRQRGEGLRVRLTRRPSFPERSQRETETLTPPAA